MTVSKKLSSKPLVGKPPKVRTPNKSDRTLITSNESTWQIAGDHAKHLILMLRDALGLRISSGADYGRLVKLQTIRFVSVATHAPLEKIMKWWYGNTLSWILGDQPELAPSPLLLGDGEFKSSLVIFESRIRRFLRSVFRRAMRQVHSDKQSKRRKAMSIGQTFLQMKKGTPLVSEELIGEAKLKHKKAITGSGLSGLRKEDQLNRVPGLLWSDVVESTEKEELLMKTIRGIVNELLPKGDYAKSLEQADAAFPSFSGYFERTRTLSGAVGRIAQAARVNTPSGSLLSDTELDRMAIMAMRLNGREAAKGRLAIFNAAHKMQEMRPRINEDDFLRQTAARIRTKHFDASPVFLQEPLKVRTITKGPSFPYWVLKPLQQYLWNKLRVHPTFQLVGHPISGELLGSVFDRQLASDEAFVSGDYSAATDNLKQWLSRFTMDYILKRICAPNWLRRLASKSLVGHRLHYEDAVLDQINGQLMGAPLSFPILCIVNAALCSAPLRRRKQYKRCPLKRLPVLVNGDDCGMMYTPSEYAEWRSLSTEAGMSPSVGKCYYHKGMIQLNSELYLYKPLADGKTEFSYVPYLNFSLCTPYLSKGGSERHWTSYGSSCREFLRLAGASKPEQVDRLVSIWIRRMSPFLVKNCPIDIAWGLPQCLGGLGLPLLESKIHLSEDQQKLASVCFDQIVQGINPRVVTREVDLPPIARDALKELIPFEVVIPGKAAASSELFAHLEENSCMSPFLWRSLYDPSVDLLVESRSENCSANFRRKMLSAKRRNDVEMVSLHQLLTVEGLETKYLPGFSIAFGKILKPVALYAKLGLLLTRVENPLSAGASKTLLGTEDNISRNLETESSTSQQTRLVG